MRRVVPFRRWHLDRLNLNMKLSDTELDNMERQNSYSLIVSDEVVACAGTVQLWPGRHQAWAYMTPESGKHMRWITREVLRGIEKIKGRVEMTVLVGFEAGQRWARMLGFTLEAPVMKAYAPDGTDQSLWARIN